MARRKGGRRKKVAARGKASKEARLSPEIAEDALENVDSAETLSNKGDDDNSMSTDSVDVAETKEEVPVAPEPEVRKSAYRLRNIGMRRARYGTRLNQAIVDSLLNQKELAKVTPKPVVEENSNDSVEDVSCKDEDLSKSEAPEAAKKTPVQRRKKLVGVRRKGPRRGARLSPPVVEDTIEEVQSEEVSPIKNKEENLNSNISEEVADKKDEDSGDAKSPLQNLASTPERSQVPMNVEINSPPSVISIPEVNDDAMEGTSQNPAVIQSERENIPPPIRTFRTTSFITRPLRPTPKPKYSVSSYLSHTLPLLCPPTHHDLPRQALPINFARVAMFARLNASNSIQA